MIDPNYMEKELADYPSFREWLNKFDPDWQLEHSGYVLEMLEAWKAGWTAAMKWVRGGK